MDAKNKTMLVALLMIVAASVTVLAASDDSDAADATMEITVKDSTHIVLKFSETLSGTSTYKVSSGETIYTQGTFTDKNAIGIVLPEGKELSVGTYTVQITGMQSITGTFTYGDAPVEEYTITITHVEGATIVVMNGEAPVNDGDKVPAGTVLDVTVTPAEGYKLADGQEATYKVTVTENVTIEPNVVKDETPVDPETYKITFVDYDGTVLEKVDVKEGEIPVYSGQVPVREADTENTYAFAGWEPEIVAATADATYIATYTATPITPIDPNEDVDMLEMKVNGSALTSTTFTKDQVVIVDGTWTLTNGTTIVINGQLVVPEGSTLVVEPGATLVLDGKRSNINVAEIEGTLIISEFEEDDNEEPVYTNVDLKNGTMEVTGTVDIDGNLNITGGELVIEMDADVTVSEEGVLSSEGSVVVKESALLTVNGIIAADDIDNYGTVVINSSVPMSSDITISQMASGAVVQIDELTTSSSITVKVTDENAVIYTEKIGKNDSKDHTVKDAGIGNTVDINVKTDGKVDVAASVSDITITTSISSSATSGDGKLEASERYYTAVMAVEGNIAADEYYTGDDSTPDNMEPAVTIGLAGSNLAVSSDLAVGSFVSVTNNGKLTVSASFDVTAEDSKFTNAGEVTLSGEGITKIAGSQMAEPVNATMYQTGTSKDRVYNYVTLDTALSTVNSDSTVKQITALGKNTVTASATVPADVTLTVNGQVSIGAKNGSDVILTIAENASVKGSGYVDVKGTLYANDKSDVKLKEAQITADVYSEQMQDGKAVKNGWAKWTNLTTALNEANPGDVIEVYRTEGNVKIETNTTIPADVTLYVEAGKASLMVMDGITLTVNGTLDTEVDVLAETRFATIAMDITDGDKSSVIVVNGYLFTAQQVAYADGAKSIIAGAPIAGVYYEYDGKYAISTLENAVAVMDKVETDLVVKGPVTAGDVSFTATDDCTKIVVSDTAINTIGANPSTVYTLLTVSTLTVSGASVEMTGAMTGSISVGDATVAVGNVTGMTIADNNGKMELTGTASTGATAKSASVTVSAGEVSGKMASNVKTFTVASGATLVSDGANVSNLVIDGTVSVAANKNLNATTVTVNGNGTLAVAASSSTSNAGTTTIGTLNAGVKSSDYTGAAAIVNGPLSISAQAFVASDAILDNAAAASLPSKSTEYYVEESLWMTVYSAVDYRIGNVEKAPVENAYFSGKWYDSKNADATEKNVGAVSEVYADIEYEVYNITLLANEGVDDVFIDGIMMYKSGNTYTATIAAGTHKVTYTLANGYDGTATLYVDGTAQSGDSFTASGTPETDAGIDMKLQLSGIEKSGYVDPVDPTPVQPTEEKDDGMTITDYLLIVLVVLIVIIAILVAVRLMRS